MTEVSEAQKTRFWKWLGWCFKELTGPEWRWAQPDGTEGAWIHDRRGFRQPGLPAIDEGSVFSSLGDITFQPPYRLAGVTLLPAGGMWSAGVLFTQDESPSLDGSVQFMGRGETPALAVFWAGISIIDHLENTPLENRRKDLFS